MRMALPEEEHGAEPHLPEAAKVLEVSHAMGILHLPNCIVWYQHQFWRHGLVPTLTDRCHFLQPLSHDLHDAVRIMSGGLIHDSQLQCVSWAKCSFSTRVGPRKKPPTSPKIFYKMQGKHCFLGTCGGLFWWTNPMRGEAETQNMYVYCGPWRFWKKTISRSNHGKTKRMGG